MIDNNKQKLVTKTMSEEASEHAQKTPVSQVAAVPITTRLNK